MSDNRKIMVLSLIIFLASFLFYARTINFERTDLDDGNFVHTAASAYERASLFDAFKNNVMFGTSGTPYYRPILAETFVIGYKIAGESEKFAHFVNVLLHAFSSLLFFLFLNRYLFKRKTAFLASLLFIFHPLVIYTAAWIPGRNDSVFMIAFLSAFAFFIESLNHRSSDKRLSAALIAAHIFFLLICFFTRESSIILPFLFAIYFFLNKKDNQKLNFIIVVLWICSIAIFIFSRKAALNIPSGSGLPFGLNLTQDNQVMTFDYYSAVLFLRAPFAANSNVYLLIGGMISFALFAFLAFYKKDARAKKENLFYLLLPLFFILPAIIGERLWFQGNRVYAALLGFIIILFSFLSPYIENTDSTKKKIRQIIISAIVVLIVICASISWKKTESFDGALPFWEKIIEESEVVNITAHKFHAYALINAKRPREAAVELLPICRSLDFSYDETNYALGQAFLLSGEFENAAIVYELMIERNQMLIPQTYAAAIIAYFYLNNQEKSEFWFDEFSKKFNLPPQEANNYLNAFNNYLRNLGLSVAG